MEELDNRLEIPFDQWMRINRSLLDGGQEYFTIDGMKKEVILIGRDIYLKESIDGNMTMLDYFEEPVILPDSSIIEQMPNYQTIKRYYETDPISVLGCNLFVSEDKTEFSIYHVIYDAQLAILAGDIIKSLYWSKNKFIPPSIFKKIDYYMKQNYLNKRLILQSLEFLGTTACRYTG